MEIECTKYITNDYFEEVYCSNNFYCFEEIYTIKQKNPITARFFSPDPFVQAPSNSQSYNRYSYCLNNPLVYTDPSGEFFGTVLSFAIDGWATVFSGGINGNKERRRSAWRKFDPTSPWSKTNKAWKIDKGLLKTDPNRSDFGRMLQFGSRFIWELPQTVLGNSISHIRNISGNVTDVSYYGGSTLVNGNDPDQRRWGFTLGSYINSNRVVANPYRDGLFRHEYGHVLQSRLVGSLYLTYVGLPSLIGSGLDDKGINDHSREWYETQANRMSERYFRNFDLGALTALPWNDNSFPREYNPNWYWIFANPSVSFAWWLAF